MSVLEFVAVVLHYICLEVSFQCGAVIFHLECLFLKFILFI